MDNSWIKLSRKFIESPIWIYSIQANMPHLISLWIYLLLNVNWQEKKWYDGKQEIIIPPGSIVTSIENLAEYMRITSMQARTALAHYEKMKMITRRTTNKWTQIWIVNWTKYQGDADIDNKQDNKRITNEQQTDNKRITTTKEYKNIRNKEYIIADKPQSRLPIERQKEIHRIVYHLEDTLKAPIINWGKQAKALDSMLKAGYTENQIVKTITYMATKDEFFRDKGFDLMTVANTIGRYKAEAQKRKGVSNEKPNR